MTKHDDEDHDPSGEATEPLPGGADGTGGATPTPTPTPAPASATPPARSGAPGWAVLLAALVGLGIGAAVTYVVTDGDDDETPVVDCVEATQVVNTAIDRIDEINENSEVQDATFFAALIVEQRTISYSMDVAPICFPLSDRAGAAGLLDGLQGLLAAGVSAQAPAPTVPDEVAPDVAPIDDSDVAPDGSDEGDVDDSE